MATCNICGTAGHFAKACEKAEHRYQDTFSQRPKPNTSIGQVQDVFAPVFMQAPTIEVILSNITSSSLYGSCTETPDASADACILGISTVDHLSIHLDQVRLCLVRSLTTANGPSLYCIGTLVFTVTYCDHSIKVTTLDCRDYDSMLLSCAVCQALSIVLQDYLNPSCQLSVSPRK